MPSLSSSLISTLLVASFWKLGGVCIRRYFCQTSTVLYDVENIGNGRPDNKRIKGTAVICGGSIAGLWAARICADHFEDVLVIEPEAWLGTEEGRSPIFDETGARIKSRRTNTRGRVQQYTAAHIFQPLALQALRRLFPGFDEEIIKRDGRIDGADLKMHVSGKHIMRLPLDKYPNGGISESFYASRETYELLLRRLVTESSERIRWLSATVTAVQPRDGDPSVLDSVFIRHGDGFEQVIPASLIVDCTGSSQTGLKWLKRVYPKDEFRLHGDNPLDHLRIEYDTLQPYRTYRFSVPPEKRKLLAIPGGYDSATWIYTRMPIPGVGREYIVVDRLEGHRIQIGLGGWGNPDLPMDVSEIKPHFEKLSDVPGWVLTLVDQVIEHSEPISAEGGRFPKPSWIQYERSPFMPSNFIAIGDSVMVVNPTFGQGCTKACIGAVTLDGMLRSPSLKCQTSIPEGFGASFFRKHAQKIENAWSGTKPIDYLFKTTTPVKGENLSDERLSGELSSILMQMAIDDEKIDSTLWHVRCFLSPPSDLLQPLILLKVMLFWMRQKLGYRFSAN